MDRKICKNCKWVHIPEPYESIDALWLCLHKTAQIENDISKSQNPPYCQTNNGKCELFEEPYIEPIEESYTSVVACVGYFIVVITIYATTIILFAQ